MRFTPAAIAMSLLFATVSSVGFTKTADVEIKERSARFMALGEKAQNAKNLTAAVDLYETALAVDPRNRSAFIALAQIANAQKLPGKAIRLYREALTLEPNDLNALAGQGEALVQRGAVEKARQNLSRIKALCLSTCSQIARLSGVIKAKESALMLSAKSVKPNPTGEAGKKNP